MKRLYKSNKNKVVGGVCSGIGERFDIDPAWVRIIFVILAFVFGLGIILYLAAWLILPYNPKHTLDSADYEKI